MYVFISVRPCSVVYVEVDVYMNVCQCDVCECDVCVITVWSHTSFTKHARLVFKPPFSKELLCDNQCGPTGRRGGSILIHFCLFCLFPLNWAYEKVTNKANCGPRRPSVDRFLKIWKTHFFKILIGLKQVLNVSEWV